MTIAERAGKPHHIFITAGHVRSRAWSGIGQATTGEITNM